MRKHWIVLTGTVLVFALSFPALGQDSSPSLGDIARQAQRDKAKDKAGKPAAKTLTNDDLPSASAGVGTLGDGISQATQLTGGDKSGANLSPAQKLAMLETVVNMVESLDRSTLAHNALQDRDVDFPGRAKWEDRLVAARQTYVVQVREVIQRAKDIVAAADSLKGTQDPNDPRVKELGAKLQNLIRDGVRTDAAFQAVMMEGRDLAAQAAH